ncbi:MAG: hypothetical protein V4662_05255 [Verrucomicrobiota bacterium]
MRHLLTSLLTLLLLSQCNGGNKGDHPDINVRWSREYPLRRSEYSTITFSRKVGEQWVECLAVAGTHLEISYTHSAGHSSPVFILTTVSTRVVLAVDPATEASPGKRARNLGLHLLERRGGIVHELKEGDAFLDKA